MAPPQPSLHSLPSEILRLITSFIPTDRELLSITSTCRRFHALIADPLLFRPLYLSLYDPPLTAPTSWLDLYRAHRTAPPIARARLLVTNLAHHGSKNHSKLVPLLPDIFHQQSPAPEVLALAAILLPLYSLPIVREPSYRVELWEGPSDIFALASETMPHLQERFPSHHRRRYFQAELLDGLERPRLHPIAQSPAIPGTRWFGVYEPRITTDEPLTDLTLSWSLDGKQFTGEGEDIGEFVMKEGTIGEAFEYGGIEGWRTMNWKKFYTTEIHERWEYEGILIPGGGMVVGVWGNLDWPLAEFHRGSFVLWRVPEDAAKMSGRDNRLAIVA